MWGWRSWPRSRNGSASVIRWRVPWRGERAFAHDRGKVLMHAGLMLAGGGEGLR